MMGEPIVLFRLPDPAPVEASSLKTVTNDPLFANVLKYPVPPGPSPGPVPIPVPFPCPYPDPDPDLDSAPEAPEVPCILLNLLASPASLMARANSLASVVENA